MTDRPPQPGPAPSVSVVVPVYKGAATLEELVARLDEVLAKVADRYEIVLVNDGSPDQSWEQIEKLATTYPSVRGIDLMRNFGQHNALLAGIRAARYELLATLDDDLQNPPEELPLLLARMEEGADVVYGTPADDRHSPWRVITSKATKIALQGALGADMARNVSAFRVFRTQLRDSFAAYDGAFVCIDVLLSWGTDRFASVPVEHHARQEGRSNYTVAKLVDHAWNMLTGFSVKPLRVASFVGFFFALVGVAIMAVVVVLRIVGGQKVPGFAFLASMIAVFSGAQMFAIGVIGEYLARMHSPVMRQPAFAVRKAVGGDAPAG